MVIMDKLIEIERNIIKRYRKYVWSPFVAAINDYKLIETNDNIAVFISGDATSYLLAKCLQEIKKHGKMIFNLKFFVYGDFTHEQIISINNNLKVMDIPAIFINYKNKLDNNKLFIETAKNNLCNKVAQSCKFEEITEDVLYNLLEKGKIKTIMPKENLNNEIILIRPTFLIKEKGISLWEKSTGLEFINLEKQIDEKMENIKKTIEKLKESDELADINIFKSVHNVNLDTIISYIDKGKAIHFLDDYDIEIK
jgi:tRNA(Ile)-lysidine synthase TilS/MesJ